MNVEFIEALDDLEREKGISKPKLLEAVEKAMVSAYKGKNKYSEENVVCSIDPNTGEISLAVRKIVVDEVDNEDLEVALDEVLEYDDSYKAGDVVEYPLEIDDLGRIAAQTAKQVVVQTVRDIERGMVFDEFSERQGGIITGNIQRVSGDTVFISIGRTEGIMPHTEQVRGERYNVGSRMKFYITEVKKQMKGPQIFLSRSHPNLVKKLFELEVPEVKEGIISIENVAREGGSRTKMAVVSHDASVDPVGACVGNRGVRVQAVVDELFGEKIDIIPWSDDTEENISSSLSPAGVEKIIIDEEENSVTAVVPDFQLSLAIGKEGQNVRLAAKLCGIKIDIKSHSQFYSSDDNVIGDLDEEGFLDPDADFTPVSIPDMPQEEPPVLDGDDETEAKEKYFEDDED